jgi:2-keto-4-pentenoate hydratase/2-oxohepta-3-ene-1,7-dioic acid hydratase in catechol pathway
MASVTRRGFLETSARAGMAAAMASPVAAADDKKADAAAEPSSIRLCRYQGNREPRAALYFDDRIVDLKLLADAANLKVSASAELLDFLPGGKSADIIPQMVKHYASLKGDARVRIETSLSSTKLLVPIPEPKKLLLLAGNYNSHIKEGGGKETERKDTFPYFFWKPPSMTLTNPGDPIRIPVVSHDHVDWELELGVIMGKRCRDVAEKDALGYVAGYAVCNDVSDRHFQINKGRKKRDKDSFFDWLHGKWHDTFMPMGPCVLSAASVADPQKFPMKLRVNDKVMQDANTDQMIFSVAAIVSILSTFTTLEPGDVISTGTPAGVGAGMKPPVFLKKGDVVEARIEGIGVLRNPVA